jgi:D-lyxose ketol-isomerase
MRRSQINRIISDGIGFFAEHRFALPPLADWSPGEWQERARQARGIVERGLGWDVTDFGRADFEHIGLILFTLRNGLLESLETGCGVLYAEKAMIVRVGQVTPMHRHRSKTEDIINRGGGRLAVKLYPADANDGLGAEDVRFVADGLWHEAPAGHVFELDPGASVTLTPDLYHSFWAVDGPVLVGEVSTVNDDRRDNRFYEEVPRFPAIDEDESPIRLLVSDYERYL